MAPKPVWMVLVLYHVMHTVASIEETLDGHRSLQYLLQFLADQARTATTSALVNSN